MATIAASAEETAQGILGVVTAARARWPEIDISVEDFSKYLRSKLPNWQDEASLEPVCDVASRDNAVDLYLVCACLRGVAPAIRVLEKHYIEPALLGASGSSRRDDLRQAVLERLLLRSESGQCRLEEFSGLSPLRAWIRVVAKRVFLNDTRGQANRPTVAVNEVLETQLLVTGNDPEMDYLRARYSREFKAAFRSALGKLDAREVLMLRMHAVEKASGAEMASLFGVNRATIVRWMADTRKELLSGTRLHLQQVLKLSRAECDSVVRLVMRQLDTSLSMLNDCPSKPS